MTAFAGALGLVLLAAPLSVHSAHAFTFEDKATVGGDNAANLSSNYNAREAQQDPRFKRVPDRGIAQQGNGTFQFYGQAQSFDQRYNSDHMFSPNTLMGR